jgi:hypothetical protein
MKDYAHMNHPFLRHGVMVHDVPQQFIPIQLHVIHLLPTFFPPTLVALPPRTLLYFDVVPPASLRYVGRATQLSPCLPS